MNFKCSQKLGKFEKKPGLKYSPGTEKEITAHTIDEAVEVFYKKVFLKFRQIP